MLESAPSPFPPRNDLLSLERTSTMKGSQRTIFGLSLLAICGVVAFSCCSFARATDKEQILRQAAATCSSNELQWVEELYSRNPMHRRQPGGVAPLVREQRVAFALASGLRLLRRVRTGQTPRTAGLRPARCRPTLRLHEPVLPRGLDGRETRAHPVDREDRERKGRLGSYLRLQSVPPRTRPALLAPVTHEALPCLSMSRTTAKSTSSWTERSATSRTSRVSTGGVFARPRSTDDEQD